jgi:hypothetical protein
MIIRLTQRLAKKIDFSPERCYPVEANAYADWSAHLFTAERTQYIIFSNTATLYSMIMYGRGTADFSDFIKFFLKSMAEFMREDGLESLFDRCILPEAKAIIFSKQGGRRVQGSINDFILSAKLYLTKYQMSLIETAQRINEAPMSYLKYDSPKSAFIKIRTEK